MPLLPVGAIAPAFTAVAHTGQTIRLADFAGKQVVLWFFPEANTPGCLVEGGGFRDRARDFHARGAALLGVSVDTVEANLQFATEQRYPFPLLCDTARQICLAYGAVASRLERANRVTYLIDKDGKIKEVWDEIKPITHAATVLAAI